ncbi:K(+)-transporting ATPase subunit C [Naumannella cuiyingiana]|nr:K(+)-transporting ATPase subunit C [Naumannella cuiyingiana]
MIMSALSRHTFAGLRALAVFTLLLGIGYPLLVFGIGQVAAPWQAGGSLVSAGGRPVGSALIGQTFDQPGQLWGRPSAAGDGYDAQSSGGSNLGPNDAGLTEEIAARRAYLAEVNGVLPEQVPADAVTASGSGLDPHISPAYAEIQVERIARARGVTGLQVRAAIAEATDDRLLGFLGQPTVNVVQANLALDRLS